MLTIYRITKKKLCRRRSIHWQTWLSRAIIIDAK